MKIEPVQRGADCIDIVRSGFEYGGGLWRSLKYECVYPNAFDNMKDVQEKLNTWIDYYNHERPHSSLNDQTPNEVYKGIEPLSLAA